MREKKMGDTISRSKLLEEITDNVEVVMFMAEDGTLVAGYRVVDVLNTIERFNNSEKTQLSTEDATKGTQVRWKRVKEYGLEKCFCERCGEPCGSYFMGRPRDRFCKWCGAKMEGSNGDNGIRS